MVNNPKFKTAIRNKIGAKVDTTELEKERADFRKQLQQCVGAKNKLASQMDALDVTDKFYDRKYQDMADRLDQLYSQIGDLEEMIGSVTKRIENLKQDKLSGESIYKILLQFDKLYDEFNDLEKKKFMQSFVEEVQIHEEENERGQFLKSISFRFPVYYNGKEIRRIEPSEDGHKKYADGLTKENLEGWDKEKTDETVILLAKTSKA